MDEEFNTETLTDAQCKAIKEAWRFSYPDMVEDVRNPFVDQKDIVIDGEKHKTFFIFGNFIYFDIERKKFIIRKIMDKLDSDGEFTTEEDGSYSNIKGVIRRLIIRQAQCRLNIFFLNECDKTGKSIPFSSRYECAMHSRVFKEMEE